MQPGEPLWQRRQVLCVLACPQFGVRAVDRLAERGRLPTDEREVAIDPLKLVTRGTGALGRTLGCARVLRDLLAGAGEVRGDAATFALAFAPLLREGRGSRRELLIAREE